MLTACAVASCAVQVPPASTIIGLMGDTPYSEAESRRLDLLLGDINAAAPAFVAHVGDIGTRFLACNDPWLQARRKQFARLNMPFVLLPGDNEWTDCKEPVERLRAWRAVFCKPVHLQGFVVQSGPYCEHVRWEYEGLVFVALNVPGSNNNFTHPERGPRMTAVYAWLDEGARLAETRKGLVVLMQANPFISLPRDGYVELREKLIALGAKMPGRVVLVHGDTHTWHDDEPIPGMRRIEVWGAPFVSWLAVPVREGALGLSSPRHQ